MDQWKYEGLKMAPEEFEMNAVTTKKQHHVHSKCSLLRLPIRRRFFISLLSLAIGIVIVIFLCAKEHMDQEMKLEGMRESIALDNRKWQAAYEDSLIQFRMLKQNLTSQEFKLNEILIEKENLSASVKSFQKLHEKTAKNNTILMNFLDKRVDSVQKKTEGLQTKITHPINPYKDCIVHRDTCQVSGGSHWKACSTRFFPIEEEGYFTILRECSYTSRSMQYSEVLTPFESDGQIRCDCDVLYPGANNYFRGVDVREGTCILTIRRCPTSMNLFPL